MLKELIAATALLAPVSALAGNWGGTNFAPDNLGAGVVDDRQANGEGREGRVASTKSSAKYRLARGL